MVEDLFRVPLNEDTLSNLDPALVQQILSAGAGAGALKPPTDASANTDEAYEVHPTPGFVIKTTDVNSRMKVFVNVVMSDEVPRASIIEESDLDKIMDENEEEMPNVRVPMSLLPCRNEMDKSKA